MSRKRREVDDPNSIECVNKAVAHLRAAREYLALVGAQRAAARVRASIKSADGARRHIEGCYARSRSMNAVVIAQACIPSDLAQSHAMDRSMP